IYSHERTVGQHHIGFEEIINGKAVFPCQITYSTAKGQSANTGTRNNSGRYSETKCVSCMIYFVPNISATHSNGIAGSIYAYIFNSRKIDDHTIITNSQSATVVATASDGQQHIMLPREIDRSNYIRHISTHRKHSRIFIDHSIKHGAQVF